jgi:hypothetical protein
MNTNKPEATNKKTSSKKVGSSLSDFNSFIINRRGLQVVRVGFDSFRVYFGQPKTNLLLY